VEGLGKDKVSVSAYADDQWVGGKDGLDEIHLLPNVVVRGDEGDVLIASVVNETGRRLIGLRVAVQSGWVLVGMKEGITDVALVQRGAVRRAEMGRVIRLSHWF
jgi:hypothetical protein